MTRKVVIYEAEEEEFWAEVLSLPGCFTQGESIQELEANLHETIEGWLLAAEPENNEFLTRFSNWLYEVCHRKGAREIG